MERECSPLYAWADQSTLFLKILQYVPQLFSDLDILVDLALEMLEYLGIDQAV